MFRSVCRPLFYMRARHWEPSRTKFNADVTWLWSPRWRQKSQSTTYRKMICDAGGVSRVFTTDVILAWQYDNMWRVDFISWHFFALNNFKTHIRWTNHIILCSRSRVILFKPQLKGPSLLLKVHLDVQSYSTLSKKAPLAGQANMLTATIWKLHVSIRTTVCAVTLTAFNLIWRVKIIVMTQQQLLHAENPQGPVDGSLTGACPLLHLADCWMMFVKSKWRLKLLKMSSFSHWLLTSWRSIGDYGPAVNPSLTHFIRSFHRCHLLFLSIFLSDLHVLL